MIAPLAVLVLVIAPLVLGLTGLGRARDAGGDPGAPWNWRLTLSSALLCTLAFNLTFFIQELFLVLPKALTPGLHPTLYHNNHHWQGENPLASLFQGTGALAILISAVACALWVRRRAARSTTLQLLLLWMAYQGIFQALPQVVIGALSSQSDVGMARTYLRLSPAQRSAAALAVLALMPVAAWWLTRHFLGTVAQVELLASPRSRVRSIFQSATLPALIAIPLIIPFRVPRELTEVVLAPLVALLIGTGWMQALAPRVAPIVVRCDAPPAIGQPLVAVTVLLLVFQLVLRRGIAFY